MADHSHAHDIILFLKTYWELIAGATATIAGAFYLFLHKWFPTHAEMQKCRDDLSNYLQRHEVTEQTKYDALFDDNKADHNMLRGEISSIRRDIGELKNLLISHFGHRDG